MKKEFFLRLLLGCCCLAWIACDKQNDVPDPVVNKDPFDADFTVNEHVGDSLVATDSVLIYSVVSFEPIIAYDTYQWTVGEDERTFTEPTVTLRFTEESEGTILVRLIAKGKANPLVKDDDGIDTVAHTFHVIPWSEAPIIGKYQGYFASQPDDKTQVVEVRYISPQEDPSTEPFGGFELINVNQGCELTRNSGVVQLSRGARACNFDAYQNFIGKCTGPDAWLKLQSSDTLNIDYSYGELGSSNRFKDQFTGVRVKKN